MKGHQDMLVRLIIKCKISGGRSIGRREVSWLTGINLTAVNCNFSVQAMNKVGIIVMMSYDRYERAVEKKEHERFYNNYYNFNVDGC